MKSNFSFQWHITDECDQRCKHCYIFAEDNSKPIDRMSWESMLATLENCEDFCREFDRQPYFFLTGGDPILHDRFWDLAELLKSKQISFSILGNPFHLDLEVCRRLKSLGCERYQLSIDGLEKIHDFFRKPGSFKTTFEKIPILQAAGIRVAIMTTVSKLNSKDLPKIIDRVVESGADIFSFARYCPTSSEKSAGISPEEYRDLLKIVDKKFAEYESSQTYFDRKDHLWMLFDFENGRFKIPEDAEPEMIYDGCSCGNSHLTILPSGDVLACRRVRNSRVGNVLKDRLVDLWLNEMEKYRDYDRFEKCSRCELLRFCRGCPATAENFYAADPQCWKEI